MMDMGGMKDMKKSGKEKNAPVPMGRSEDDKDKYPYGLQLRLEDDEIKKLGCGDCQVGDEVHIMCIAKVTGKNSDDTTKGVRSSMSMQIQKMKVMDKAPKSDMQKIMSGEKRTYTGKK